jgi:hypothetical protein
VFNGSRFRNEIVPRIADFIVANGPSHHHGPQEASRGNRSAGQRGGENAPDDDSSASDGSKPVAAIVDAG